WRSGRAVGGRSRGSARPRSTTTPPAAGPPYPIVISAGGPAHPRGTAPPMRVSRSREPSSAAYAGGMAPVTSWRILLADDHRVVRAGLRTLLAADARCEIVGEASSIGELRALAHNLRPDLIVLDVSFGTQSALTVVPELLEAVPAPRIIVLTMHD